MWIAQKGLQSRNSVPHRKKTRHSAALAFQAFCVPWVSSLVDHTVNLKKNVLLLSVSKANPFF